ncbi:MAG: hypothetical protein ACKORF_04550 [Micrococcales bacterium]
MASQYKYGDNPHVEVRNARGPATRANIGQVAPEKRSAIQRFNDRVGLGITNRVGTMWAAYLFFGLTLVSLPAAIDSGNVLVIVSWIAQTFLQLVLLPIIIVGQNIQAKAADARAIATYNDADAILHDAREIQKHLTTQDEALTAQDQALDRLLDKMAKLEKQLEALASKGTK